MKLQLIDASADQQCCQAAVAVDGFADGNVASGDAVSVAAGDAANGTLPVGRHAGTPANSTGCGCNPDSSSAILVNDEKRPFSLELLDVSVVDGATAKRIDDAKLLLAENELGANPEQCCGGGDCNCNRDSGAKAGAIGVGEALSYKETIKNQSCCGESVVGFGSENFDISHVSIFAGSLANVEGK